jgi:hypothetical protein
MVLGWHGILLQPPGALASRHSTWSVRTLQANRHSSRKKHENIENGLSKTLLQKVWRFHLTPKGRTWLKILISRHHKQIEILMHYSGPGLL